MSFSATSNWPVSSRLTTVTSARRSPARHRLRDADRLLHRQRDAAAQEPHRERAEPERADHHAQQQCASQRVSALRGFRRLHVRRLRLLHDGSDDVVDRGRRRTIDTFDEAVHHVRGIRIRGVVMLERVEVAALQRGVRGERLVDAIRIRTQRAQLVFQARQRGVGRAAFVVERIAVFGERSRIGAAQQQVFPFLHLLLELDLRDARRVGRLRVLAQGLSRLDLQRVRVGQRMPAFQSDHHGGGEQHRAKQRQLDGDFQIAIKRHCVFPWRTGSAISRA
ncbi:hypothetical protein GGD41_000288 [Paraburkholderia bryophila]|uniref:Uncharacterized protein n=1 Tax=Paraburkholderia bryophila TaxID=420952 RepID=A0A7Y9W2F9_9BURK|nr:hypothetical protein [Paraburkholderia bryophila]